MGEVSILTEKHQAILKEVANDAFLSSQFYFTGGTALSEVYLHHRASEDLDFFSEKKFDGGLIGEKVNLWSEKLHFRFTARFVEPTNIYILTFPDGGALKVDFGYYPYRQIELPGNYKSIKVDSKLDIAINKLLTITQWVEVKDFVDLYYLLQDYSFWDLQVGVERKFRMDIEPVLIAADFLAVEEFEYLPKMLKPLKLQDLKQFFRVQAKKLAGEAVE
jgi:predicted nucleotidyltransferase component of viral defense system